MHVQLLYREYSAHMRILPQAGFLLSILNKWRFREVLVFVSVNFRDTTQDNKQEQKQER